MAFWNTFAGKQPGDPTKGAERILDVIQLKGVGRVRNIFFDCRWGLIASRE